MKNAGAIFTDRQGWLECRKCSSYRDVGVRAMQEQLPRAIDCPYILYMRRSSARASCFALPPPSMESCASLGSGILLRSTSCIPAVVRPRHTVHPVHAPLLGSGILLRSTSSIHGVVRIPRLGHPASLYLLHPCSRAPATYRTSCTCAALAHPCARDIPYILYMRRSCASLRPRHTVHPVHKKAGLRSGGLLSLLHFSVNNAAENR